MKTFNDDQKLKDLFLKEAKEHQRADRYLQGTYEKDTEDGWKGCAVGCAIKTLNDKLGKDYAHNNHAALEQELGIPEWLWRLEDNIFEHLPKDKAMQWPVRFIEALPVGKTKEEMDRVKWQFQMSLLKENIERVSRLDIDEKLKTQVLDAIRAVLVVHENALITGVWDDYAAESAAWSAEGAARNAVWSAESAVWSAESAESAGWSVRSAASARNADELVRLLEEAK